MVHRSLNWKAPIRIFIFDNRVEIHSPGTLPNGLQVEDIMNGTSMPRNNFLFSNAIYLLPYTGVGSGIQRALEEGIHVEFNNDERTHEFIITIKRKENLDIPNSNLVTKNSDLVTNLDTENPNLVTERPVLVTNLDTKTPNLVTQRRMLSNKEKDIVNFCSVPRTAKEILERIGVTNQTKNREKYVVSLIEAGYLVMTNPDNPNASNQKYKRK